jgi:hypothetical protein
MVLLILGYPIEPGGMGERSTIGSSFKMLMDRGILVMSPISSPTFRFRAVKLFSAEMFTCLYHAVGAEVAQST